MNKVPLLPIDPPIEILQPVKAKQVKSSSLLKKLDHQERDHMYLFVLLGIVTLLTFF